MGDLEILGVSGSTQECLSALVMVLTLGPRISSASLVTANEESEPQHLLVLHSAESARNFVIRSGFTSGYSGEGPAGLSEAILRIDSRGIPFEGEYFVSPELFEEINTGELSNSEVLSTVFRQSKRGPLRYDKYVPSIDWSRREHNALWVDRYEPRVPLWLVSPHIFDLVPKFEQDADATLLLTFRRIESRLRERLRETQSDEDDWERTGLALIEAAFGDKGILQWGGLRPHSAEHRGLTEIPRGAFMGLRNPRTHHEYAPSYGIDDVHEFLWCGRLLDWIAWAESRDVSESI